MAFDKTYMLRAIELARGGIGAVNPNPLVGAVIVKNGKIIGEGFHRKYGELHAERDAFSRLTEDAEGAEMYVTLEPCCHFGKQPPCTHAIVEHKIKTVYVGSNDPNPLVAGKGISYLRENGIEVFTEMMKEECDRLNPVFFHSITKDTPYVCYKYAMTLDGKIATGTGKSQYVSNENSRKKVQAFRNEFVGIMVGIGTVLADDPLLTCRMTKEENNDRIPRNPVRIVVDSKLQLPVDSKLVRTANDILTIDVCVKSEELSYHNKKDALQKNGVKILEVSEFNEHVDLKEMLVKLKETFKIDGILLEGGGTLAYSMLSLDLVNELRVFVAPKIFGGVSAKTPVEGNGVDEVSDAVHFQLSEIQRIDGDVYLKYMKE